MALGVVTLFVKIPEFYAMKTVFKKKPFVIDKISEDSYYENLLLGLSAVLRTCPFVSHIRLERYAPASFEEVSGWEYTNSMPLPEDMRNFYLSSNGFSLSYKFQYDRHESDELNHVMCGIEINPVALLQEIQTKDDTYLTETGSKILAPQSKIFRLAALEDSDSCVVLAQFNPVKPPNFWLYYKMKIFYLLAKDFTSYFRMAIAHLGIPGWQLAALKASLPEYSAEIFQILAPSVLQRRHVECCGELNQLDTSIFESDDASTVEGEEGVKVRHRTAKSKTQK